MLTQTNSFSLFRFIVACCFSWKLSKNKRVETAERQTDAKIDAQRRAKRLHNLYRAMLCYRTDNNVTFSKRDVHEKYRSP